MQWGGDNAHHRDFFYSRLCYSVDRTCTVDCLHAIDSYGILSICLML